MFRSAAEKGLASAQDRLARCYVYGAGVEKNLVQGAKWYLLAKAGGIEDAGLERSALSAFQRRPQQSAEGGKRVARSGAGRHRVRCAPLERQIPSRRLSRLALPQAAGDACAAAQSAAGLLLLSVGGKKGLHGHGHHMADARFRRRTGGVEQHWLEGGRNAGIDELGGSDLAVVWL